MKTARSIVKKLVFLLFLRLVVFLNKVSVRNLAGHSRQICISVVSIGPVVSASWAAERTKRVDD